MQKTYHHERFHCGCDVFRGLFGGNQDADREEALAVAWARLRLMQDQRNGQTQIGRMNSIFFGFLMEAAFRYRSDGYRDWPNYADDVRFKAGLVDYIQPGNHRKLIAGGVAVGDLLYGMLDSMKGGYRERML